MIASEAHARLGLDAVLFVPAASPPHKEDAPRTPAAIRLRLTELAIENDERFTASGIEVHRDLVYTRDMLAVVAEMEPDAELTFIMGSDSLLQFASWRDPEGILDAAAVAVAPRPGDDAGTLHAAAERWGPRVRVLESPRLDVSSRDIRARVAAGLPIRYLVPEPVARYIAARRLYGSV